MRRNPAVDDAGDQEPGGPAPVRRYLPQLIDLVFTGKINPVKVFDLVLPLDQVADGHRAIDERRAIKTLLRPSWLAFSS